MTEQESNFRGLKEEENKKNYIRMIEEKTKFS